ncbi:MAG: carboxymuconolactone decarboxylase family protein [Acidothermales bacterium]|nr:carboxymuconolactone decarboxylase family protein [Acidothermales bacterium]
MQLQQPRMKHPIYVIPEAFKALQALGKSTHDKGVPETTLYLVELRASQINGCSVCVEMHAAELAKAGVPHEKIFAVGAWRESPRFTEAERAALALTEAETRLADRPDAVSDEVWDFAAKHYDEQALAALVIAIAGINTWNRLNATVRQVAEGW